MPHSVVSAATSQDRGVNDGDRKQYSHASSTKPRPQQISAMLASRSVTLIIHTRVRAVRMVPRPMSAAMSPVTIVTARAGLSRAASPRRSGCEPGTSTYQ